MTLDKWLTLEKISNREFARRTKGTAQQVAMYRKGKTVPRLRAMISIYRETGGAVRPADFYPARAGGMG